MSGALAMRELLGGRSRGPAFLPADLAPVSADGLYQGLYKRLRELILGGVWPAGTRLPSSRALAADLNVSRNTAILAVEQLIADGWAESRSRSGVYVSATPAVRPVHRERAIEPDLPPFALRRPATDLFPAQTWKQLQAQAWAQIEPQRLLDADPAGDVGLRDTIARLVCAPRGLRCHADQILILPTATAAFDLIAAALLRPGEAAMVEDPCRPAVRQLLRGRGARIVGRPVDARIACVSPTVQFPTCTTMDSDTRADLLDWARARDGWVIEDDRDSDAWFHDTPPPLPLAAEDSERVVLIGSFNRLLFPGLCVAFLLAPTGLIERLRAVHAVIGGRASLASQLTLRAFIAEGHFARHLRQRRQAYAERRAAMIEILNADDRAALGDCVNKAGLHLVLDVGDRRAAAVAARLAMAGLGGANLDAFAEAHPTGAHILLGLGGTPDSIRSHGPRLIAALHSDHPNIEGEG